MVRRQKKDIVSFCKLRVSGEIIGKIVRNGVIYILNTFNKHSNFLRSLEFSKKLSTNLRVCSIGNGMGFFLLRHEDIF
ncbi:unnamed protein product [Rhizophagus irregularis]|nr:unnamed protein product [Rhizophagus irregularis]